LESETAAHPEADWAALFRDAGLDIGRFTPAEPRWSPRTYATTRLAWEGPHPEHPDVKVRVEAAAFRGRPVDFEWIGPWTKPMQDATSPPPSAGELVFLILLLVLLVGGAIVARQNFRAGRGDRRGAVRIGLAICVLEFATWAFGGHHTGTAYEGWFLIAG